MTYGVDWIISDKKVLGTAIFLVGIFLLRRLKKTHDEKCQMRRNKQDEGDYPAEDTERMKADTLDHIKTQSPIEKREIPDTLKSGVDLHKHSKRDD